MRKNNIEGMVFIGWVLLAIGILFDDVTTHLLIGKGFAIFESNPIKLLFNNTVIFLFISMGIYILISYWLHMVVKEYRVSYIKKLKGYKWRDIFVFFYCLMFVFIFVMKVTAGINNINIMADYMTQEGKEKYDAAMVQLETLQEQDPQTYNQQMTEYYNSKVYRMSYLQFLIISLGAYTLFKIGHKVSPWDLD